MKTLRTIALLAVIAAAFAGGYMYKSKAGAGAPNKGERKIQYWVDPMHPAYKSDKSGIAPDCGMQLEPVYADGGGQASAPAGERKALYYRDPQSHNFHSPNPGLNPETGNTLEPVYADDIAAMPDGTIQVSAEKQQLIGVKFGVAGYDGGSRTIRAAGRVAVDETRIGHVHTKVDGWVERVFADYTGQLVQKGEPLLTVYSPDMLASQRELLLAEKAKATMRTSTLPAAFDQSESLLQAARRRLELWDMSEAQIDQVLRTGEPLKNITVYAPMSGYVMDRKAFPQQRVTSETDLYTIVDLSRVWIVADVFEYEAPNVRVGQLARVTLESLPGRTLNARVDFIQPQIDPATRTLKVRLSAPNPGLALKPDMYADVEFAVNMPAKVTAPTEAVLDTGLRQTVFVDRGNGFFEPRQVTIGERRGDHIEILSGLKAGERIVTSGNFLIDSESQLKAPAHGNSPGGSGAQGSAMPDMPGMNMPALPAPAKGPQHD
jgi:membrane fusion protein, copper/silver efflux system